MKDKINKLKEEILQELEKVNSTDILRDLEIKYFGRKGELSQILRGVKDLVIEERKEIGKIANELKLDLVGKFNEKKEKLNNKVEENNIDITLPGNRISRGSIHPLTQINNELEDFFASMGFMVLDGPELESDYYNFEALNIPKTHPARDMQDTFYIDKKNKDDEYDLVMRTQTSNIQVRAMQKYGAPLRCVIPGRVFRNEDLDACHDTTFYQLEGLMVGEDITIANLISVLKEMLSGVFKQDIKVRVRPGYFPFVEPGLEVDMSCTICGGTSCSSCKHTGWLEMLGAGMVHPNVLRAGGVDPEKYSGFAFGMGTTRLAMMKYGVDDIRLFNSGDLRFMKQF